jgi:3-hydroxy-9,10-secoandrosta-1,3,5(10)-triene-9,17-dione monooxygenase
VVPAPAAGTTHLVDGALVADRASGADRRSAVATMRGSYSQVVGKLLCADVLPLIAAQAVTADRTRSVAPEVVAAIKASPLMAMAASPEIGGLGSTVGDIGRELAAIAAACGSTAWCLWNHLSVFHLFAGTLGVPNADLLESIVQRREWVCFPAGAGSKLYGRLDPARDEVVISGSSTFGSGCRYGEWTGVALALVDDATGKPASPPDLRFTIVRLDEPTVRIDPTWDGMGLRASATDTVHHDDSRVPVGRCAVWYAANREEVYRHDDYPVINPRYREDWVGLSDLWLAAQATGAAGAAVEDAASGVRDRRAIIGTKMVDLPMVPMRLGEASAMVAAAQAVVTVGCAEVDDRLAAGVAPTEADYIRQLAHSAQALRLCRDAMDQVLAVLGGNGLRESGSFERRYRDVMAMPLHINAHPDRVYDKVGRLLLDIAPLTKF